MEEVIVAVIALFGTLATACLQLKSIRLQKQAERRARRREEESRLSMELMDTSCDLGLVTAKAVTGQKLNGDVKDAMDKAETAQRAYQDFLTRTAAASVAKI